MSYARIISFRKINNVNRSKFPKIRCSSTSLDTTTSVPYVFTPATQSEDKTVLRTKPV